MITLIFFCVAITTILLYYRPILAISLTIFLIIILPYSSLAGISIRFEQIAVPLMLAAWTLRNSKLSIKFNSASKSLISLWSIGLISTVINSITTVDYKINFIPLLSFMVLIFFSIFSTSFDNQIKTRQAIFLATALSAMPAALFSIAQAIKLPGILEITESLYSSESRGVVSNYMQSSSAVFRAVSFFETPAYAATFFLCSIIVSIYSFYTQSSKIVKIILIISICLSIAAGFFSFSATFIGGFALITGIILISNLRRPLNLFIIIAILAPIAYTFYKYMSSDILFSANTNYQIERILAGQSFDTRFNENDGLIAGTLELIYQKPLLGWGWSLENSAFIGDSLYIYTLYIFGIAGIIVIVIPLLRNAFISFKDWKVFWPEIAIFSIILITGLGSPSLFAPRISLVVWSLFAIWSVMLSKHEKSR